MKHSIVDIVDIVEINDSDEDCSEDNNTVSLELVDLAEL